jgi:hypothetical protein
MKIKVITSYKPGTWNDYADRCVRSVLEHWPEGIAVNVYYEDREPDQLFSSQEKIYQSTPSTAQPDRL